MRRGSGLVVRLVAMVLAAGLAGAQAAGPEPSGHWKYVSCETVPKPEDIPKAIPGRLFVQRANGTTDVPGGSAKLESVWETDDVERKAYTMQASFQIKADQTLAAFVPGRKVTLTGACSVTGNSRAAAMPAAGSFWSAVDFMEHVVDIRNVRIGQSGSNQGVFIVPGGGPGARMVLHLNNYLGSNGAFGCQLRLNYEYQAGPPPAGATGTGTTTGGTTGGAAADCSGVWRHGTTETWTLTPAGPGKFTAVEQGFDNARGTATVSGNTIRVDYTTQDGRKRGQYTVTVAPDGKTAQSTYEDSTGAKGSRQWVRVSGPASGGTPGTGTVGTVGPGTTPPGPASAAGLTVQAGSRRAQAGETVTIPVWLTHGTGVANINLTISYDPAIARAEGQVAQGNLIGRKTAFEANSQQPGVVKVGLAGRSDLESPDGTLAQVTFRITGKAGDKATLRVAVTDVGGASGAAPKAATVDGEILVVGPDGQVPGDSDGDGTLTAADALNALKMSVDLIPVNVACDLNKDGKVTSTDAKLIMQKVVGK